MILEQYFYWPMLVLLVVMVFTQTAIILRLRKRTKRDAAALKRMLVLLSRKIQKLENELPPSTESKPQATSRTSLAPEGKGQPLRIPSTREWYASGQNSKTQEEGSPPLSGV